MGMSLARQFSGNERALNTYRLSRVETASPGELVLLLYNESLKLMKEAEGLIQSRDIQGTNERLQRVQDILAELKSCLNLEAGGELAAQLRSIYDYIVRCIIQANVRKDLSLLTDAERVLAEVRDGWSEAIHKPAV